MNVKNRLLVAALCLLSCLAIALQLIYESGALVQGFPSSRLFMLLFWWQALSIPLILLGTVIGLLQRAKYAWIAPFVLCLTALYPAIVALMALWPTEWSGWIATFESFPQEGILRLSVVFFPALFTALLFLMFFRQLPRNKLFEGA